MSAFLTAQWKNLLMVNYPVSEELLLPFVPAGTELDPWNGKHYVSLVGFMFENTKVKGIKIPGHVNFEEVNLRFYVRREVDGEIRRGVVFIKELVPKRAITFVANTLYGEHYQTVRMHHGMKHSGILKKLTYGFELEGKQSMQAVFENIPEPVAEGSEEEFISEHYWGYTRLNQERTSEYEVKHPRWNIFPIQEFKVIVDFGKVYGHEFSILNSTRPSSCFLADGSEISVHPKQKLRLSEKEPVVQTT